MPKLFKSAASRREFFRWVAAFLFWMLVAGCFVFSFRSSNLANQAVTYIRGAVITPDQIDNTRLVTETARGFVAEWATFAEDAPEDYKNRLKLYTQAEVAVPKGIQKCTNAWVVGINPVPDQSNNYRVSVLVNIARLASTQERSKVPKSSRVITEQDVVGVAKSQPGAVYYWDDALQHVEVTLAVKDGVARPIGFPVLLPTGKLGGEDVAKKLSSPTKAPSDFVTFTEQVIEFYFTGKDMANFLAPDAEVLPVGGYSVNKTRIVSFGQQGDEAMAVVEVNLSVPGINDFIQQVVITAVKEDRWMLVRLGSW